MKTVLLLLTVTGLHFCLSASSIRIDNDTGGWDMEEVYAVPAGSDSWGENLLGFEVIRDGATSEFTLEPGMYDLMLADEDGDMYEKFNVPILFTYVWKVTLDDLTRYASGATFGGG
jgi:hypothetical protein